jgi:hypothetical protein
MMIVESARRRDVTDAGRSPGTAIALSLQSDVPTKYQFNLFHCHDD